MRRITVTSLGPGALWGVQKHGQEAVDFMIEHWRGQLAAIWPDEPDLIVVPEACDRFPAHTMVERKAYYTLRGNQVRDFFSQEAKKHHCYIAYSAARKMEDGSYRNSTQLIDRQGEVVGVYNKNHLVPSETIDGEILCGKDAPVFTTDFGTVAFAICFDLNFHELLEKYKPQHPDLIVFSSFYHGGLMQGYWAYHCRSHFVGAIAGDECTVVNPLGDVIARSTNYLHRLTTNINLDCKVIHYDKNWNKMQAVKDRYGRGVTFYDPGHVGAVLMTCELQDKTVDDIIKEFEIETWDEYYDRSMRHRHTPGNMEP